MVPENKLNTSSSKLYTPDTGNYVIMRILVQYPKNTDKKTDFIAECPKSWKQNKNFYFFIYVH